MRIQSFPTCIFSVTLILGEPERHKINITTAKGTEMWVMTEMRVCVCLRTRDHCMLAAVYCGL